MDRIRKHSQHVCDTMPRADIDINKRPRMESCSNNAEVSNVNSTSLPQHNVHCEVHDGEGRQDEVDGVEQEKSQDANYEYLRKGRAEPLVTAELVGESFKRKLDEIWSRLMDEGVLRLGIYGMGGVGKTELAKHIYNRLLECSNFDHAYWVTVSVDFSIYKLQNAIAEALDLDLSDKADLNTRAARLLRTLTEKEKFVLILDDVWSYIPLDIVGVPDQLNGSKVVVTTRSLDLCHMMNCHEILRVDCLKSSWTEGWELFIKHLGEGANLSGDAECIATSIVDRCGGLPLMIISIARRMRGKKDIRQWRDALEETKGSKVSGAYAEVFHNLKLSYDYLEDQYLQQCFLYCQLFDGIVEEAFTNHLIAEGIIEGLSGRQAKSDKCHALLYKLQNACLLQHDSDIFQYDSDHNGQWFYMHELVRKMAFCIMNESLPSIINIGEQLHFMPDKHHNMENIVRISFTRSKSSFFPPDYLGSWPNVSTLILYANGELSSIKDSFFDRVKGLKVLDLSFSSRIETLPESVGCLENLRSLLLTFCGKLKYIPSLARLKLLEVLDLSYCSQLKEFPRGVELLYSLTVINLLYSGIKMLPAGSLTRLLHLEVLKNFWPSDIALSREVAGMAKLESLVWCFIDIRDLYAFLELKSLGIKYTLFVGAFDGRELEEEPSGKVVVLYKCNTSRELLIDEFIQKLIIEKVSIHEASGFCFKRSMVFYSSKFQLKSLAISNTEKIEYLFCLWSYSSILQSLETLELAELTQLHDLFGRERDDGVPSPTTIPDATTFSNLKTFKISKCPAMKTLLHFCLLPNLRNVEEITVDNCSEMEEIIAAPEQESNNTANHSNFGQTLQLSFPKLKTLEMAMLPKLKSIYSAEMNCESLELIKILGCEKLEKIPISLPLPSLETLEVSSESWWEAVHWGLPNQKDSLQPTFLDDDSESD